MTKATSDPKALKRRTEVWPFLVAFCLSGVIVSIVVAAHFAGVTGGWSSGASLPFIGVFGSTLGIGWIIWCTRALHVAALAIAASQLIQFLQISQPLQLAVWLAGAQCLTLLASFTLAEIYWRRRLKG
jgi:hypothetical protein